MFFARETHAFGLEIRSERYLKLNTRALVAAARFIYRSYCKLSVFFLLYNLFGYTMAAHEYVTKKTLLFLLRS